MSRHAVLFAAALIAAVVAASPAPAQAPVEGDGSRRWQLEGALGVVGSVPPLDGRRRGLIVEAQAGSGNARAVRVVVAVAYMRELGRGDVRCCGPAPGFSYTEETVVLGVGPEWRALVAGTGALALDVQYSPMWHHTIRHGSQPDFRPSPTEWHSTLRAVSAGAAWRWRAARGLSARIGARAYVPLTSVAFGVAPTPHFALTAGLGVW